MIGLLPTSLVIAGQDFPIRTDYRDVLQILTAFNDPDLEAEQKVYICLFILYKNLADIPPEHYQEAYEQASFFIDAGAPHSDRPPHRLMDWEQDERLIFPAINKIAGCEVRAEKYIHWWTFLGYFMEITDGTFSQVLSLRSKRADGKSLDQHEQEYWDKNREICQLRKKLSAEEQAEIDFLNELLGDR